MSFEAFIEDIKEMGRYDILGMIEWGGDWMVEGVERLLSEGVNPNILRAGWEYGGMTPLMIAVNNGDAPLTYVLLKYKANVNAIDSMGSTAYSRAVFSDSPFHADFGEEDPSRIVMKMLIDAGANVSLGNTLPYARPSVENSKSLKKHEAYILQTGDHTPIDLNLPYPPQLAGAIKRSVHSVASLRCITAIRLRHAIPHNHEEEYYKKIQRLSMPKELKVFCISLDD